MKQLKLTFVLTILMSMMGLQAFAAWDTSTRVTVGQLSYYLDKTNNKAMVMRPYESYYYSGSITIPSSITYQSTSYSVTSINNDVFRNCADLTSITIPNSVTSIGYQAFANCSKLTSITIPNSVTSIGFGAFTNCSKLTSLIVESGNTKYDSRDNCNAIIETASNKLIAGCKNTIIPNSVTSIGERAFAGCSGLTSITIPNSVTSIGEYAFSGCSGLTSITIPNSVTSIGNYAFSGCSGLTSVTIPNSVTSIGSSAFGGCSGLTSIVVESGNTKYDSRNNCNAIIETASNTLLWGCKNTVIPNSVTSIGSSAFYDCSGLTSVTIPNSVTSIGNSAFNGCSGLTSVTIPNSVTSIGYWAFSRCSGLTSVTIPNSVTSIGGYTFNKCSGLTSVTIPNSVTSIGISAFDECTGLTSIDIPASVTSIDNYAFEHSGLTSITIPNGVTSIGSSAFYDCQNLISVTVDINSPLTITSTTFSNRANAILIVPDGSKSAYEAANYWKEFKEICEGTITFADANVKAICVSHWDTDNDGEISYDEAAAVTTISDYFRHNTSITSFDEFAYFTGLTSIDYYAFNGCSGLTSITIPNSVKDIGAVAFADCTSLTNIAIPNSVTTIGSQAFYGCAGLTSVTIGNSVTSIINQAFRGCSSLTSVTIPKSVTNIGQAAFCDCSGLTSLIVQYGNTKYDSRKNCNAIIETASNKLIFGCKNTVIPNSVTSINEMAFSSCSGLTSITIPNSVTSIGNYAFIFCSGLTSVTIPNSVTSIGYGVFGNCSGLTSMIVESGNTKYDSRNDCNAIIETASNKLVSGCQNTVIPNSVTSIGNYAFAGYSSLTSIIIPNSVTSIDNYAFSGCSGLTFVTVETNTPPTIYANTFTNRANATLDVPIGSKSAYEAADYWKEFKEIVDKFIIFADANVKAICVAHWDTNGDGELSETEAAAVTTLSDYFYGNSSITSFNELALFTGLTSIGDNAFDGCDCLTSITIPNSVTSIGEWAFSYCRGLTSVNIPNSVTSIGVGAFYDCSGLTSVTIPNSVTSIGVGAFNSCYGLASIEVESGNTKYDSRNNCNAIIETASNTLLQGCKNTVIPNGVTNIATQSFQYCSDLTSITIPNSVTSIGYGAFSYCNKLTSVTIGNSVTSIGGRAFDSCPSLTSVTIPNSVTSIGSEAFNSCFGLTSIEVESGNTKYDSRNNCNAIIETASNKLIVGCKNTTIPNSVTIISSDAFYECRMLSSITIPNSVTSIGSEAFEKCYNLTSVTIPNSVTSIGWDAFNSCSNLTSITIPSSVTSIGNDAFKYCYSLTSVTVDINTPLAITSGTFSNRANATLYVPADCKSAYEAADYWKEFKAIKEFPDPDVNQDGTVNVVDVVDIARFVVGTPRDVFVVFLADLNNSGEVNVADAVVLVNEIAGDTQFARQLFAPQQAGSDVLTLCRIDDTRLSLQLDGSERYAAFQFDLWLPSDMDVMQLRLNDERRQGHQLLYNKVGDGHYRVVALSTSASAFNGTSGELLDLTFDGFATDEVRMDNIHFVTTNGTDVLFDAIGVTATGGTTAIHGTESTNEGIQPVYNLNGQRLKSPRKGINIIGGKKVVVK